MCFEVFFSIKQVFSILHSLVFVGILWNFPVYASGEYKWFCVYRPEFSPDSLLSSALWQLSRIRPTMLAQIGG